MAPRPHNDIVERLRLAPDADFYKPSKWFELMRDAADEIEQQRAQLADTAAFLDGLASRLVSAGKYDTPENALVRAAADCRAMAAKLRE